jgi:hypothetical protein
VCKRRAAGRDDRRLQPAVSGGGARWRTRSWAPGHDSRGGEHLRVAREGAKLAGVEAAAVTRRRRRATRRCGFSLRRRSGEVSRAIRRAGSTTRASTGLLTTLRGSWMAPCRRGGGGGGKQRRRLRVLVAAAHEGKGSSGRRSGRGGAALNSPGTDPCRAGQAQGSCRRRTRAAARGATVSGSGTTRGRDDSWAPWVSDCRAEAARAGGAGLAGPRTRAAACCAKGCCGRRQLLACAGLSGLRPAAGLD